MNIKPKISVSILAADLSKIGDEVKAVCDAGVDFIHVDVMDGHFVPNITMGPQIVEAIKRHSTLPLDVHLMITNPESYIKNFVDAGADMITVHAECIRHRDAIEQVLQNKVKAGIALSPGTKLDINYISQLLNDLSLILIMTVNPGFAGQKFMPECVSKIKEAKQFNKNGLLIAVDGGINEQTALICVQAGANILVSSSYIFKRNSLSYKEKIEKLKLVCAT